MYRRFDASGVSGVGRVLDGTIFPNGKVCVCWRSESSSIGVYDSWQEFLDIHVSAHPSNQTEILWIYGKDPPNL